jgi:hypothetical protein
MNVSFEDEFEDKSVEIQSAHRVTSRDSISPEDCPGRVQ